MVDPNHVGGLTEEELREKLRENKVFTDLLRGPIEYYLKWDEMALALFMLDAWRSCINERCREDLEEGIRELAQLDIPWGLRRYRKFVYAAKTALEMIMREKELYMGVGRHG